MGTRIAKKLANGGHTVHVWNRTFTDATALAATEKTITAHKEITELLSALPSPKIVWVMVLSGEATEAVLREIVPSLSSQDILIDAANSNFHDTDRRAKEFPVRFLGIGVSGGIIAEKEGYPCMVGGDTSAYETIKPILDTLGSPHGGHAFFGPGGAGHFVKMVHNGIEYGIMQSMAEGFDVLKHAPYAYDLSEVSALWKKGSLVSGFILDRTHEVLTKDQSLDTIVGNVTELGEARWTVEQAKQEHVNVPIIEASFNYRIQSHTDEAIQKSFTAKLLAAIRNAFGGHAVLKK
jgi:6-phosphogluconate dehydrogenase